MAETIFSELLEGTDKKIRSAGLGALVDQPIESTTLAVLGKHAHTPAAHKARQLTSAMLGDADLVLVMEERQLASVLQLSSETRVKVFLLGKWQDEREIPDPYRQGKAAFENAHALIKESIQAWATRLTL
ncbi:protein-tyrosine phosphatase [Pseudomonas sp. BS3782 TE3695]